MTESVFLFYCAYVYMEKLLRNNNKKITNYKLLHNYVSYILEPFFSFVFQATQFKTY